MSEPFRAVDWMRRQRARIDEEDRNLTWEEKSRRTTERLERDPLWQRLKHRMSSTHVPSRSTEERRSP